MFEIVERICSTVCHSLPERTFSFGGRPLPLCARCAGVYLGFVLTMIWFTSTRLRNAKLAPGGLLWAIIAVILIFAALGFAGLYEVLTLPRDLKLLVGLFFGFALAAFAYPLTREWLLGLRSRDWGKNDTIQFLALGVFLLAGAFVIRQGAFFLFWPIVILAVTGLVGSHFLADLLILSWALKAFWPNVHSTACKQAVAPETSDHLVGQEFSVGQAPPYTAGLLCVVGRGIGLATLAALMCAGEFWFYSAWRGWWEVL